LQRIVVLGCAGAGKTTFARALAEAINAPAVILDDIWRPEWGPDDLERFRRLLREAHAGDRWVSDGNFALAGFDAGLSVWRAAPAKGPPYGLGLHLELRSDQPPAH